MIDEKSPFDIGQLIEKGQWNVWRFMVVALVASTIVFDAFDNQLLGLAAPTIGTEFGIGKVAFANIFAIGLIGVSIGAVGAGWLGDKIGRRPTLIGCVVVFSAASMCIGWADGVVGLSILRFFGGLGLGGLIPSALALTAEFTPARWRSTIIMLVILCVPLGGILAGAVSGFLLEDWGWRFLFVLGGAVPLASVPLLLWLLPESPKFLVRRDGRQAALAVVLRRMDIDVPAGVQLVDVSEESGKASLGSVFSGAHRHDSFALCAAFFASLLSSYSFQSWLPVTLGQLGLDASTRGIATAAFNSGGIFGILVGSALLMRFGSRIPMLAMCFLSVLCALLLTQANAIVLLNPLLLYAVLAAQSAMLGSVQAALFSLAAHIYPAAIRSTGLGASGGIGRLGAVLSSFTAASALEWGGARGFFLSIAIVMTAAAVLLAIISRHVPAAGKAGAGADEQ